MSDENCACTSFGCEHRLDELRQIAGFGPGPFVVPKHVADRVRERCGYLPANIREKWLTVEEFRLRYPPGAESVDDLRRPHKQKAQWKSERAGRRS